MTTTQKIIQDIKTNHIQIFLFLFVNSLFVIKYFQRTGLNSLVSLTLYICFFSFVLVLFAALSKKISEKTYRIAFTVLLITMVLAISGFLVAINPYNIRVDRWSALSFFWDSLFHGKYPYSTHTHVSLTNYPSPFPFWHVLNLPFYLLGDVGIGLIFFLLLVSFSVYQFFSSYQRAFFFLLLLCISPAYWWEVAARSDSLNNAFLVYVIILWLSKFGRTMSNSFILTIVICGLIATTRLTAIIALALYFFKPYMQLPWKQKIIFTLGVAGIFVIIFSPFIFWDTDTWIFFSRNPFMSQADKGNILILTPMIFLGCFMAYKWKSMDHFFYFASVFIFIFILTSQIGLIYKYDLKEVLFKDHILDISYFNLMLPYCLASITSSMQILQPRISNHQPTAPQS